MYLTKYGILRLFAIQMLGINLRDKKLEMTGCIEFEEVKPSSKSMAKAHTGPERRH
jgi:hypothetical protein